MDVPAAIPSSTHLGSTHEVVGTVDDARGTQTAAAITAITHNVHNTQPRPGDGRNNRLRNPACRESPKLLGHDSTLQRRNKAMPINKYERKMHLPAFGLNDESFYGFARRHSASTAPRLR